MVKPKLGEAKDVAAQIDDTRAQLEQARGAVTPTKEEAGPTNAWVAPAEMYAKMRGIYDGCMTGRTMYVVPYVMGPADSPFAKVGIALGVGASGWILQFTGFDAKQAVQTPEAIFWIRILLSGIPVIGLVLALIAILRFPLTEARMGEIRQRLEATRGQV